MSQLRFEMRPVEKKRAKSYLKKSIYDPIIDQFLESGYNLVEVTVEGRKPWSFRSALKTRIKARGLEIEVSTVGDCIYLEKKPISIPGVNLDKILGPRVKDMDESVT